MHLIESSEFNNWRDSSPKNEIFDFLLSDESNLSYIKNSLKTILKPPKNSIHPS